MAAISLYIKGELEQGRRALRDVSVATILGARRVQRWRLSLLTAGMWVLLRLPRLEWLAQRMVQRWHVKRPPSFGSAHADPVR
jgi:hypothetical protein